MSNRDAGMSDDELLATVLAVWRQEGALMARLVAMLIEVEDRRLHLELGCANLFEFCMQRLGMTESEASRRTKAAELGRKFPQLIDALRTQRIHLTTLMLIRNVITDENVDDVLAAVSGKTKKTVQEVIAKLAPQEDVPDLIREMPVQRNKAQHAHAEQIALSESGGLEDGKASPSVAAGHNMNPTSIPVSAQIAPLSERRHKVQFTASSELRAKLERAQRLMRHRNVDGDLAAVVERALDLLIEKLEREKLGITGARAARPRETTKEQTAPAAAAARAPSTNTMTKAHEASKPSRRVSVAVRREVVQRDGEQCAFIGADGVRCAGRDFLELDHCHPHALGGGNEAANIRLLCRAHNRYAAEKTFGRKKVAESIATSRAKRAQRGAASVPVPVPPGSNPVVS